VLEGAAANPKHAKESTWLLQVSQDLLGRADTIKAGIYEHAVVTHPEFGQVFAYEVDGFGSRLLMDDANIPSLLSLPLLGFVDAADRVYQNTRRMILSQRGNPYFLRGANFSGIGGPHIGPRNAWPMSVLVQAMTTSDSDSESDSGAEILECLGRVKNVSIFGLVNESVDVHTGVKTDGDGMTRSWFAWANSVFAQTLLYLVEKRPELVLKADDNGKYPRYKVGEGWIEEI